MFRNKTEGGKDGGEIPPLAALGRDDGGTAPVGHYSQEKSPCPPEAKGQADGLEW